MKRHLVFFAFILQVICSLSVSLASQQSLPTPDWAGIYRNNLDKLENATSLTADESAFSCKVDLNQWQVIKDSVWLLKRSARYFEGRGKVKNSAQLSGTALQLASHIPCEGSLLPLVNHTFAQIFENPKVSFPQLSDSAYTLMIMKTIFSFSIGFSDETFDEIDEFGALVYSWHQKNLPSESLKTFLARLKGSLSPDNVESLKRDVRLAQMHHDTWLSLKDVWPAWGLSKKVKGFLAKNKVSDDLVSWILSNGQALYDFTQGEMFVCARPDVLPPKLIGSEGRLTIADSTTFCLVLKANSPGITSFLATQYTVHLNPNRPLVFYKKIDKSKQIIKKNFLSQTEKWKHFLDVRLQMLEKAMAQNWTEQSQLKLQVIREALILLQHNATLAESAKKVELRGALLRRATKLLLRSLELTTCDLTETLDYIFLSRRDNSQKSEISAKYFTFLRVFFGYYIDPAKEALAVAQGLSAQVRTTLETLGDKLPLISEFVTHSLDQVELAATIQSGLQSFLVWDYAKRSEDPFQISESALEKARRVGMSSDLIMGVFRKGRPVYSLSQNALRLLIHVSQFKNLDLEIPEGFPTGDAKLALTLDTENRLITNVEVEEASAWNSGIGTLTYSFY